VVSAVSEFVRLVSPGLVQMDNEVRLLRERIHRLEMEKAVMLHALRSIYNGSVSEGRWLDENGNEVEGYDPTESPDHGAEGVHWEAYDGEDQDAWIDGCAGIAQVAIKEVTGQDPAEDDPDA
jgi:hypothetical protein